MQLQIAVEFTHGDIDEVKRTLQAFARSRDLRALISTSTREVPLWDHDGAAQIGVARVIGDETSLQRHKGVRAKTFCEDHQTRKRAEEEMR